MGIRESIGSFGFRKAIAVLAIVTSFTGLGFSQIAVQEPSSRDNVKACADYADEVMHDRWDMTERTDLGWRIFNTVEQPQSFLRNISFAGGVFSAVSDPHPSDPSLSDVNISILDSAYKYSALNGKNGTNFPIDADKYTIFALRMSTNVATPGFIGQLFWSKETIYDGVTTAGEVRVQNGWNFVIVRIPSLSIRAGSDPWAGIIRSLRFDPFYEPDKSIQIDWIRLAENDAGSYRTITWTGASGYVDLYLDNDNNPSNGNLGTLARSASGGSYTFLAGALMPGDYYVAIVPAGATTYTYAAGYYHVNDTPILNFTKPTAKGSTDDFITTAFGNPWDMANTADVEYTDRVLNPQFTTLSYEDLKGAAHADQTVYLASGMPATPPDVGDPIVIFLRSTGRGASNPIDTSKYHNLTFKMGITGAQSVNDGSIARVQWRVHGETKDNESQDIIINHKAGGWVMSEVTLDMRTILQETGSHLSNSGWTGMVESFRIDPHEFCDGRQFFFDDVKITADWTAYGSFPIEWSLTDTDNNPSVSLYYDTDDMGYNGTLITTLSGVAAGAGTYAWDTSSVPNGKYWIYARVDDGTNVNTSYPGGPVIVRNAGAIPTTIQLSKNRLYMGAARAGTATSQEEVLLTNSGQGTLNWQAASTANWLTVTPASGTGNAALKIGISVGTLTVGTYQGKVLVTDPDATNSPQTIDVTLKVYAALGGDAAPFGNFDTPTSGATVSGSVPVCGWALDDIEVSRVEIRRAPVALDPADAIGSDGLIFVGNATFVKGARPDVESAYAAYPRADRAGWGYMLLTYGLPNSGMSDAFQIHAVAFDATGHRVDLGTKSITSDNAHRIKPFGTIDTPDQGGVASGSAFVNFGWVLTPLPKTVPTDGSTIQVYVDSVPLGNPTYNQYRKDIADAYPGYNNSNGAVGFYFLDTTQYVNGTHTIGWSATDDAGEADGMGSRFFEIQNLGSSGIGSLSGSRGSETSSSLSVTTAAVQRVFPYIFNASLPTLVLDRSGMLTAGVKGSTQIEIEELQPIEIKITGRGGREFAGWGRDMSRSLPVGSTLDRKTGTFTWLPGPGFLGKHVLHFAVTKGRFISPPVTVVVNIKPN